MLSLASLAKAVGLAAVLVPSGTSAATVSGFAGDLFQNSMSFLDQIYDPSAGYLYYFYWPLAAGKHETRSSVWYATGLLQRNQGDDLEQAVKIITNVIEGQNKNVTAQW